MSQRPNVCFVAFTFLSGFLKSEEIFLAFGYYMKFTFQYSVFAHKLSGTQPSCLHSSCPRLLLQYGKAVLCQKPSGQQSLKYLLSCPSESLLTPALDGVFFQIGFTFASGRQQGCLKSQIVLKQRWSGHQWPRVILPILSYCYRVMLWGS